MIEQDQPSLAAHKQRENWPDWARSLEVRGREVWRGRSEEERRRWRRSGYIGAVVVNSILLAVAHAMLSWHVPFITLAWADVLWAIDLSLGGAIVANAIFVSYDEPWFRNLAQIVVTALSLVAWLTLVQVFPVDFGDPVANEIARFVGVMIVFALAIAILVRAIVWIVARLRDALS